MGGREVGGLANQLACHMELDNAQHRELVRRFWGFERVAHKPGLKAVELFEAVSEGQIKALWIIGTNPVDSLPEADTVKRGLAKCPFVVVSDAMAQTDTTAFAKVLLPARPWGEKDGGYQFGAPHFPSARAAAPAGEAMPDWWILCRVAHAMGAEGFDYAGPAEIFREYAALSGYLNDGARISTFPHAKAQRLGLRGPRTVSMALAQKRTRLPLPEALLRQRRFLHAGSPGEIRRRRRIAPQRAGRAQRRLSSSTQGAFAISGTQ